MITLGRDFKIESRHTLGWSEKEYSSVAPSHGGNLPDRTSGKDCTRGDLVIAFACDHCGNPVRLVDGEKPIKRCPGCRLDGGVGHPCIITFYIGVGPSAKKPDHLNRFRLFPNRPLAV